MSPRKAPAIEGRAVVIGAGLSGLTAALYLLGRGHEVTVVEASDHVGGRSATENVIIPDVGDVRCDTGATVLTMPSLIEDAIAATGQSIEEVDPEWEMIRLDPSYLALFTGDRRFPMHVDPTDVKDEIARFIGDQDPSRVERVQRGYDDTRRWLESLFDSAFDEFMNRSFDTPLDMVSSPKTIGKLLNLTKLGAFGTLGPKVQKLLGDDDLARMFSFQALYTGVGPRSARAVYGCVAHMDTTMGVFYPVSSATGSGVGAIPELLATAVRKAGGEIHLNTAVEGLTVRDKTISSVDTDSGSIDCSAVISTVDQPVLDSWIEGSSRHLPVPRRFSPSAVVAHGAVPVEVSKSWPKSHHTISFGESWDETFNEICATKNGRVMSDPSLLITRPAVTAPDRIITDEDGRQWEPFSVLAPTPNLKSANLDWDGIGSRYIEELAEELEHRGYTGVSTEWKVGRIDTPSTWLREGMGEGSPFGYAHLFRQTGPFRPRNYSPTGPRNLVTAGSTTVPGVGVPTVMLSGALAVDRFAKER